LFINLFWQGLKRKKPENLDVKNILAGSHSEHRWLEMLSPVGTVPGNREQRWTFNIRRTCFSGTIEEDGDGDKMAVGVRRDVVFLSSFPSPQSQRIFAIFCVCFGGSENLESSVTVVGWVGKTKTYGIRGVLQFHESEGLA
jgi:hypothetical protein